MTGDTLILQLSFPPKYGQSFHKILTCWRDKNRNKGSVAGKRFDECMDQGKQKIETKVLLQ